MSVWDDFWTWAENSQLGANVVGGLMVALIVALLGLVASIVKKSWRDKIWGGLSRLWKRVKKIRITTTDHIEREYERGVDDGWAGYEHELREEAAGRGQGLSLDIGIKPPQSEPPRAKPRWSLYANPSDPREYTLMNASTEVGAKDVELSAPVEAFSFLTDARWGDVMPEEILSFRGKSHGKTYDEGALFEVAWTDERGERQEQGVFLDGRPQQARIYTARMSRGNGA